MLTAFDPELERMVALKLIHTDQAPSSRARTRLLREAQALAKLQHPNVVVVHDVGTFNDQIFIAMELVQGPSLSVWLAAGQRSWQVIRDTFLAAGRGLAAAHAVGIVHRDFKPSNVIVSDDRVVVVDFGLALRPGADLADDDASGRETSILDIRLTLTGERVGTPRYMAPEQHTGAPVTALADQFAFANSLWTALYGSPPFTGTTAKQIHESIKEGSPALPSGTDVPTHVGRALQRALAAHPEARWPELGDLLTEIAIDPAARRRRWRLAGAVIAAFIAVDVIAFGLGRRASVSDLCAETGAAVAPLWDDAARARTQEAFRRTGRMDADETFAHVDSLLRQRVSEWMTARRDACEATAVRNELSPELVDARETCLGRARSEIVALVDALEASDATALDRATPAAARVADVGVCTSVTAIADLAPFPKDGSASRKVERLRDDLAHLDVLLLLGKIADGRRAGHELIERARGMRYLPVLAAAMDKTAWFEIAAGNDDAAIELGYETARVAAEIRDYRLVALGMRRVAFAMGFDQQRFDAADVAFESAAAAATLAGNPGDVLVSLYSDRGQALYLRDDYQAALPFSQLEHALSVKHYGPGSLQAAVALSELARAMQALGPTAAADRLAHEALAKAVEILGPRHPMVLSLLNDMGLTYIDTLDFDTAAPIFERELRAYEALPGGDDAGVATAAHHLAVAERGRRRLPEARALLERAIEIRVRKLGHDHPLVAASLVERAEIDRIEGKFKDALAELDRAIAIFERTDSRVQSARAYRAKAALLVRLRRVADARSAVGAAQSALDRSRADFVEGARLLEVAANVMQAERRWHEAVVAYDTAISRLEMRYGASSPAVVEPLVARGGGELADGHIEAAAADAERAEAIVASHPTPADRRAAVELLIAKVRWAQGNRDGALKIAHQARVQLASLSYGSEVAGEIDRWLADR